MWTVFSEKLIVVIVIRLKSQAGGEGGFPFRFSLPNSPIKATQEQTEDHLPFICGWPLGVQKQLNTLTPLNLI